MKTVKEVSEISGLSIRTLRYYDEIGLLSPTQLTDAGYRLYDDKELEKLQEILFFRELKIPLVDIKKIMDNPDCDKEQILSTQQELLEHKRNRLNGIIALLEDVKKGANRMSFEAFNDEYVKKITEHMLEVGDKESFATVLAGRSIEEFQRDLADGLKDEKRAAELIKIHGSKDKAVEASLRATGNMEELQERQDENDRIYKQFVQAKDTGNTALAVDAVEKLIQNYKAMFGLDNARALLLEMARDYLEHSIIAETMDKQYGLGITEYVGHAIQDYYGV
ncbi:MAG: MerR family transcriptional regulator [Blautia sp.]|uniref:MerR family transcriptional regulator n=1 Tax=Blautia sp. TaxID=1955243 RepID=UPI002E781E89|nr:MerR family transcriptional regulator [Blautia sp.]MEE1443469.1 MerR family transcriptional regulator [Blautia sp.]